MLQVQIRSLKKRQTETLTWESQKEARQKGLLKGPF